MEDKNQLWQEILPAYIRLIGKVDENCLHDALVKTIKKYKPSMGLTPVEWFYTCIYNVKKTEILYTAREYKKRVDVEDKDLENIPSEEDFSSVENKIDFSIVFSKLPPQAKKIFSYYLSRGEEVPEKIVRKFFPKKRKDLEGLPLFGEEK